MATLRGRGRRKFARGKRATAICDRSGFKYLLRELVREPGTGLMVHKSMNDGMWNRVDHPQNFPADTSESLGLQNPRPDLFTPVQNYLLDDDGVTMIFDDRGFPIFVDEE